jgi:hypothetical protein
MFRNTFQTSAMIFAFLICLAGLPRSAEAGEHFVSTGTAIFDASSVMPGDTITLQSGSRGPLQIKNIKGSSSARIIVRNDPKGTGPVVIRRTSANSGGFVLHFRDCRHFVLDGSHRVGTTYGIVVTSAAAGDSPSSFIHLSGFSSDFTIKYVEVDGKWPALAVNGIGIQLNDHAIFAADNPGVWRENILLERNYIHDVEGEGMYIGPNWKDGGLPLRNIEIRNNEIFNTGFEGAQLKSAISGNNSIHHNSCRRCGSSPDTSTVSGQESAFSLYESKGDVFNNWIEESGERGIQHYIHYVPSSYGVMPSRIYNNVIIKAGTIGHENNFRGFGIYAGSNPGYATVHATIYNNTIVDSEGGITVNSATIGGSIHDNIVAGASPTNTEIQRPSAVAMTNNALGTVSSMGFVDASAKNFSLVETSSQKDAGSSSGFADTDYEGVPRPQNGSADRGAFEYRSQVATPKAPTITTID